MWHIQNPIKVFEYIFKINLDYDFQLITLINDEKLKQFPKSDISRILSLEKKGFSYQDVKIKDPNNPAKLINSKVFIYKVNYEDN